MTVPAGLLAQVVAVPIPDVRRWWWFGVATLALATAFIVFGATGYGSVHIDANYLMLPAVSWAAGDGFVNPLFPTAREFDPQGVGRFLYHGPAFQILLRALLHPPTGPQALRIVQWINALNVVLFAWFVWRVVRGFGWATHHEVWLAMAAGLLSFSAVLMAAVGRPETFAITLILVAGHLLGPDRSRDSHPVSRTVVVGALLGLLVATHPLTGLEASLVLAAWYGMYQTAKASLLQLAIAGTVALGVTFGILTVLFPFPVGDWVLGMRAHAALLSSFVDLRVIRFFLLDSRHPALGLTVAVALVTALVWWSRHRQSAAAPWVVSLAAFALLVVATRMSVLVAFRVYDLYPMFPVVAVGLMVAVGAARLRKVRWAILVALALPAVGFVRHALLYSSYRAAGMSLVDAREAFAEVLAEEPGPIGVTRTLWLLTEDYDRLRSNFSLDNLDHWTGEELRRVAVQQFQYASVDSLEGYRLGRSYRRAGIPTLAGVPLARSIPGYQFTVYHRFQPSYGDASGLVMRPAAHDQ